MPKLTTEEYNDREMAQGNLTWDHIEILARFWQRHHGLYVDGRIGPVTRGTLFEKPSDLALAVVRVAQGEIGKGEGDGWNNSGPQVYKYRRKKYTGKRLTGAWCAYFASWCLSQACKEVGVPDDIGRQGGAKRLVRLVAEAGQEVDPAAGLLPGDFVAWDRGARGSWQGHVGIVSSYSDDGKFLCIEGNRGAYPALVTEYTRWLSNERLELVGRLS